MKAKPRVKILSATFGGEPVSEQVARREIIREFRSELGRRRWEGLSMAERQAVSQKGVESRIAQRKEKKKLEAVTSKPKPKVTSKPKPKPAPKKKLRATAPVTTPVTVEVEEETGQSEWHHEEESVQPE